MKRIVALILIVSMCMFSVDSFAEVQNSEKDPDGNWKALIEIMISETLKEDDMLVSDTFYNDCFCWFMLLYMNDMYSGKAPSFHRSDNWEKALESGECDGNDIIAFANLHMILSSFNDDEQDNEYSLTSLMAAAQTLGGYEDVPILDFVDIGNLVLN